MGNETNIRKKTLTEYDFWERNGYNIAIEDALNHLTPMLAERRESHESIYSVLLQVKQFLLTSAYPRPAPEPTICEKKNVEG